MNDSSKVRSNLKIYLQFKDSLLYVSRHILCRKCWTTRPYRVNVSMQHVLFLLENCPQSWFYVVRLLLGPVIPSNDLIRGVQNSGEKSPQGHSPWGGVNLVQVHNSDRESFYGVIRFRFVINWIIKFITLMVSTVVPWWNISTFQKCNASLGATFQDFKDLLFVGHISYDIF